jgi:dihydroorotate dehydrogenase
MRLRDIEFGPCLDAAGTRGFFGDPYWFHKVWPFSHWYDFSGSTFVAKTTTTPERTGNMPLTPDWKPQQLWPKCIWVDFSKGIALNAVGLGGPGAAAILAQGFDNRIEVPGWPASRAFMISWGPEGTTLEKRLEEFKIFVRLLKRCIVNDPSLRRRLGLQINLSCPNSDTDPIQLAEEAAQMLGIVAELGIPVLVKVNLLVPVESIRRMSRHPSCDGICIANTIPFGALPNRIPWDEWFPDGSPLAEFKGGGGLSGAPLLPLVAERIQELRKAGVTKPLNAGGGILKPEDVDLLVAAGLQRGIDSVFIGSIAMLRPWNIKSVIKRAHQLLE